MLFCGQVRAAAAAVSSGPSRTFCCRAKGNLRVETSSDAPHSPGPISFLLRNGTETGGDGRKRNYEVRSRELAAFVGHPLPQMPHRVADTAFFSCASCPRNRKNGADAHCGRRKRRFKCTPLPSVGRNSQVLA